MSEIRNTITLTDNFSATVVSIDSALKTLLTTLDNVRTSVDKLQTAFDKPLSFDGNGLKSSLVDPQISNQLTQMNSTLGQIATNTKRLKTHTNGVNTQMSQASKHAKQFHNYIRASVDSTGRLYASLRNVGAAVLASFGVGELFKLSDSMTSIKARIGLINDGLQTTDELLTMIFNASNRSRGAFFDTAQLVARIGMNAGGAFKSTQELVGFAELLNKTFVTAGTNAEEMRSAILQLSQGMASNRLQGDELRTIFEAAPILTKYIADYMGVTQGAIRDLASEGKITAEVIKNSMIAASKEINERFEQMPKTFAQLWTIFKNRALDAWRVMFDRMSKFVNTRYFQDFFDNVTFGLYKLANASVWVLDKVEQALSWIYEYAYIIKPILGTVIGMWLTYKVVMLGVAAVTGLVSAATWLLGFAFTPLGAAILIIGAIIGGLWLWCSTMNETKGTAYNTFGFIYACFATLPEAASWAASWIKNEFIDMLEKTANGLEMWSVDAANWVIEFVENARNWIGQLGVDIYNKMGNGFTGWINNVKDGLRKFFHWVIDAISPVLKVVDYFKKTNFASELKASVDAEFAPTKFKEKTYEPVHMQRQLPKNLSDFSKYKDDLTAIGEEWRKAWEDAYEVGETNWNEWMGKFDVFNNEDIQKLWKTLSEAEWKDLYDSMGQTEFLNMLKNTEDLLNSIKQGQTQADKIGRGDSNWTPYKDLTDAINGLNKTMDTIDLTEYMKESASRDTVNRVTTVEVTVPTTMNNTIEKDVDLDGVFSKYSGLLAKKIEEKVGGMAKGSLAYGGRS